MKSKMKSIASGLMVLLVCVACSRDHAANFLKPNEAPVGYYDAAKYEKGVFTAFGWAADNEDGAPVDKVLVYVDGKLVGEAKLGVDRPDVVTALKKDGWMKSGWQISQQIPLQKGLHKTVALGYDKTAALLVSREIQFSGE